MIGLKLTGDWSKASKQLVWMQKHWQEIARVTIRRAVLSLADEAGVKEPAVRFIKVERKGGREVSYGVAVEPTLEEIALERLRERVVFLELERSTAPRDLLKLMAHGPWVVHALPMLPKAEEGHLVVRDAALEEREQVLSRNRLFLRNNPLMVSDAQRALLPALDLMDVTRPMLLPPASKVQAEEDAAYNLTRGEFGLGDKLTAQVWRPALMRLIQQRLGIILDDLVDDLARGKLDVVQDEDRFEDRSERWLASTRAFAFMFNEDTEERVR